MTDVATHYEGSGDLADRIREALRTAGKDLDHLTTADLSSVDEFHIRGRKATLELAGRMNLDRTSHVLDIGSGLGGPARTLAETYGCRVTGIDLTPGFCEAAQMLSEWVGLADRAHFQQCDATSLPFCDGSFDAAMTIHVAMNIKAKDRVYAEAKRVLRSSGTFAIYDVLQGEGGAVRFPTPWATEPSISHLATPSEMRSLLAAAGFEIVDEIDSTEESLAWFAKLRDRVEPPGVTLQIILGDRFPEMMRNQLRNLTERRIRTVAYICRA